MRIFNIKSKKSFRQYLRKNSTKAENILWWYLRAKKLNGYKFRRQHGIGPYIVDFYCPKARLVIEVDGDTHFSPQEIAYDRKRQAYIESWGIKVIRFSNLEVYEDTQAVLDKILKAVSD